MLDIINDVDADIDETIYICDSKMNFVEDPQLQQAILSVFNMKGEEPGLVREYAETLPPAMVIPEVPAPVAAEEGDPN